MSTTFVRCIGFVFALSLCCASVEAADFFNLDFESGIVSSPLPQANQVPNNISPVAAINASNGLPGWTVRLNSTVSNTIWGGQFGSPLDSTSVTLISPPNADLLAIQGQKSVMLYSVLGNTASISQTATIPAGTNSLQFLISTWPSSSVATDPVVWINGSSIPLASLSSAGNLTTMGADVSAFAGTNVELRFLAQVPAQGSFPDNQRVYLLDNIQFSPQVIPEPGSLALVIGAAIGCVGLTVRARRRNDEVARSN